MAFSTRGSVINKDKLLIRINRLAENTTREKSPEKRDAPLFCLKLPYSGWILYKNRPLKVPAVGLLPSSMAL